MEAQRRRINVTRSYLIAAAVLASLIAPSESSEFCHFPAIFNFGDSNSDTGGLSAAFGAAPPPNGETFFHRPAGRYCNGRLIIDFIAQGLGLPFLHAYLDSIEPNFAHGANFATAGSTIRQPNATLSQSGFSPISLDVQSWEFSQFINRSQLPTNPVYKSLLPKMEYFSQALYTFDIGQNDLVAAYFDGMATEEVIAAVPNILNKFSEIVKNIYWQGGRYFWIHNTGPFGCLAYVLDRLELRAPEVDEHGCGASYNSVAQYFNKELKNLVAQLREELPFASLTYVDIYSLKYKLFSEGQKYGFKNPLRACCGHGGKYNYNREVGCGGYKTINGTSVLIGKSCKHPSKAVIWDGVHYTEAANRWIFNQVADGSYSDPPNSLRRACKRRDQ